MSIEAYIYGKPIESFPEDLYIPADALEIILEPFSGPLDLLLYLVKRQNVDILEISIAEISLQYMQYIELMKEFQIELASEYLTIAAWLAEMKSRLLLPQDPALEDEEDPRVELAKRLQQYELYKQVSEELEALPRQDRDVFPAQLRAPEIDIERPWEKMLLDDLINSYQSVLNKIQQNKNYTITHRELNLSDRMNAIMNVLAGSSLISFYKLIVIEEGIAGVVVTFIALLELVKSACIEVMQTEPYSIITVRKLDEAA